MTLPEGWTDDMSVEIIEGKTEEQLTFALMDSLRKSDSYESMIRMCVSDYGLVEDDADLAIDRVQGGIVRALTGLIDNRPDATKDPLAHCSFNEVWKTLPKKHWWSSKRESKGVWSDWYTQNSNNS
ncbi:hypothetical protein [Aliikangiella maris]|uniref:Uncharacterized protein n=2 Tax=Aliikangiella maris TaxID=3162458 RepID=A0ABV2BTP5_9GAMM